ncbi:unnamed protein product [Rotaria magnacalcarata]|uniref:Cystatin domain-containing protein n=1 Tax=Rotaria magnacalcarata TaxID=392030 RepID=A0A815WXQ2_9BILA|nr:unnamed protein product [Rotaria magnacalcarata]CAF1549160.1 unnamed protein product [Rotaria magnacalcarata]CAF2058508.1 unnamed protein product [Rotaria magnacalcarata]CAF2214643.1 unnamed protein product [Rotaria magnacalcarata]CAF2253119.1 unnamed protein product [Rotaria magnacalcarata]
MSSANGSTHSNIKCGGIGGIRPVNDEDLKIWDMYKTHLETKIQDQFHIPTTHTLKPVQVSTQVVAGQNYFFKVELPEKKYATARVYHVPWQQDTHGKPEQVAIHAKLLDNPDESVGHF